MIPTEIVDYILGFLRNDHITLKTCSTVFPQLVYRYLYSHISLHTSKCYSDDTEAHEDIYYDVQFSELIPLLNNHPEIAFCVEGLRIIITVQPASFTSLELLPIISRMLPFFRRIKAIELKVEGILSWFELGSDFCTSFQNLLLWLPINEVKIDNVNGFPLDSFGVCRNLRKLILCGQFANGEGVSTSPYPRLSSLRIEGHAAGDLTKAISWMKSNTLHTLSLQMYQSFGFYAFHPLIEARSAALVDLELDLIQSSFAHSDMSAEIGFGNARFPALKSLVLRSGACFDPGNHSSSLPCFTPFLSALSRTSTPHSVHLLIHPQFYVFRPDVNVEWPDITFFDGLSVFRLPIELYLSLPIKRYFEASPEIRRMVAGGKLTIIIDG